MEMNEIIFWCVSCVLDDFPWSLSLSLFLLFSGVSVVLPFLYLMSKFIFTWQKIADQHLFLTLVSWVTQNRVSILPKLMNIQQPLRHALPTTAAWQHECKPWPRSQPHPPPLQQRQSAWLRAARAQTAVTWPLTSRPPRVVAPSQGLTKESKRVAISSKWCTSHHFV